jgi:hypothetical protein
MIARVFALVLALVAAPALAQSAAPASGDFVLQILEPTGGKVLRPRTWFYSEGHRAHSYVWTLSREDASKGRYTTGMRIQTLVGVRQVTGKTPKQFLLELAAKRQQIADRVVSRCPASRQPLFTRVCLETEEGPYHIRYSLYWGNDGMDLAVVAIQGTTKELWNTYLPVFNRMGEFELIDMTRFEKK